MIIDLGAGAPVRPVMTFTIGGQTYQYTGTDIDIQDKLKITADGDFGWKMWCYDSLSFTFSFINSAIDICAVGHGGVGGNHVWHNGYDTGGAGGTGGQVIYLLNQSFVIGDTVTVSIGDSTTVAKNGTTILSPQNATGAAGGAGQYANHNGSWEDFHSGADGTYAFGDTDGNITFDGVKYAPGGGGGGTDWRGSMNLHATWGETNGDDGYHPAQGYGGHGNGGQGGKGIVLMRFKP